MNVGYANGNTYTFDLVCPLCKSDIYVNKYGSDYKCMNELCILNQKASVIQRLIQSVLDTVRD